ncbi:MAG: hypothetical protein LAO51_16970 [Acidobacteriia bacterium]|nr:hypothetical protein [Terriglobia bacterium]
MAIELGELRIEIGGLDDRFEAILRERYGPYAAEPRGQAGGLSVRLGLEDREYFIDPPESPEFNPVFVESDGGRVRFLGHRLAGWFDALDGEGVMLLARGSYETEAHAIENYLRAAVAWQAASRGGALVHAASAVRHGRGYLFFGESGAGKSTLCASNRRGTVVSDDLSLLLPAEGGKLRLVGSPFRGTYEEGEPVVGAFPLAAGFRIVKDHRVEVREAPRVRSLAELVGNLPFVAEEFARRPDLFERIERAFASVPLAHLHFRMDDSYWDAIERSGL